MGDAYRKAVAKFAEDNGIEVIAFKGGDRKIDVVTPYLEKAKRPGVAVIGKAQEVQRVTMGSDVRRDPDTGCPHYAFKKVDRRVTGLLLLCPRRGVGTIVSQDGGVLPLPRQDVVQRA
jgi:hypothetical protein